MRFKKIGLIGKLGTEDISKTLKELLLILQKIGVKVVSDVRTTERYATFKLTENSTEELGKTCDLIIVVGGDGTFLNAARLMAPWRKIMLGVNLGRLGFLTDITPDETMEQRLVDIFDGAYQLETRSLLEAKIIRDGQETSHCLAFNDVVIHKWEVARMIEFETRINNHFVSIQRSDGIIISTPTGSTAYSLSGGGPILEPSIGVLNLVPISPHTLSSRPIVIDDKNVIEIELVASSVAKAQVTSDGHNTADLHIGDVVQIRKSNNEIRLIHSKDYEPFSTWREKLHWNSVAV